jgi:hypothetical protein
MKGVDFMQTVKSPREKVNAQSGRFNKRIGSTDFEVAVFFSATNKETLNDKIARLIKSETGKVLKQQ